MVGQHELHSANDGQTQASSGLASPAGLQEEFFSSLPSSPLLPLSLLTLFHSHTNPSLWYPSLRPSRPLIP